MLEKNKVQNDTLVHRSIFSYISPSAKWSYMKGRFWTHRKTKECLKCLLCLNTSEENTHTRLLLARLPTFHFFTMCRERLIEWTGRLILHTHHSESVYRTTTCRHSVNVSGWVYIITPTQFNYNLLYRVRHQPPTNKVLRGINTGKD